MQSEDNKARDLAPVFHAVLALKALVFSDLGRSEMKLAVWLLARAAEDSARCADGVEATTEEIAVVLGLKYAAAARTIKRLVTDGWLEPPRRRGALARVFRWSRTHPALASAWIAPGLRAAPSRPVLEAPRETPEQRAAAPTTEGDEPREVAAIIEAHKAERRRRDRRPDFGGIPKPHHAQIVQFVRATAIELDVGLEEAARLAVREWLTMPGSRRQTDERGVLVRLGHPLRLFFGPDLEAILTALCERRAHARRADEPRHESRPPPRMTRPAPKLFPNDPRLALLFASCAAQGWARDPIAAAGGG